MDNTRHYYLPYMRSGMAALAVVDDAKKRPSLRVEVEVDSGENSNESMTSGINIALYGPGDVLGFNDRVVARTQPLNNIYNFNPGFIPFIEFKEADFLWRYSSRTSSVAKYWIPWLSLIVLKDKDKEEKAEFAFVKNLNQELPPQIEIQDGAVLPGLHQTWRWAHVHMVDRDGLTTETIQSQLAQRPAKATCRLLCPRRLKAGAKYTAFVIPTYQLGANTAKGEDTSHIQSDELTQLGTGERIPYYYKWEFRTGLRGDFEYLIKQLEYRKLENIGFRTVRGDKVGYGLENANDNAERTTDIHLEGALSSPGTHFNNNKKQSELAKILNNEEVLAPPLYGNWYFKSGDKTSETLLNEINLNYQHRYAAGLGAQIIRDNQQELMKSAWQQYKEVQKANRVLNRARFGREVSNCLYKRFEDLPANKILQMALPLQSKVSTAVDLNASSGAISSRSLDQGTKKSIHRQLQKSRITNTVLKPKIRKYLVRKYDKSAGQKKPDRQLFKPVLDDGSGSQTFTPNGVKLAVGQSMPKRPKKDPPPENLDTKLIEISKELVKSMDPTVVIEKHMELKIAALRTWEKNQSNAVHSKQADLLTPIKWYPEFHTPMYRYLRDKSEQLLLPGVGNIPPNTVTMLTVNWRFIESFMVGLNHEFASELRWREYPTDMRGTYFRKFWDTTIYSVDEMEKESFRISTQGDKFLQSIQDNFPAASNYDSFTKIEAIFKKESNDISSIEKAIAKAYEDDIEKWLLTREEDKDIKPIGNWDKKLALGEQILGNTDGKKSSAQMVLLVRGDILKKFPSMSVYLAKKKADHPDFTDRIFPIYEANLPPDITLLGFQISEAEGKNYFLVFEEPLSELQYGLDETDAPSNTDPLENLSWQHFKISEDEYLDNRLPINLPQNKNWNDPSYIAKVMTQRSVRVAIALSRFLPNELVDNS